MAHQGIYSFIGHPQIEKVEAGQGNPFWAAIYAIKDRARDAIGRLVPDPEASLLQGILLGIRSGIPVDLYDDYNTTGTSHIVVMDCSLLKTGLFGSVSALAVGKPGFRLISRDEPRTAPLPGIGELISQQ